jgi:hypothetical protein
MDQRHNPGGKAKLQLRTDVVGHAVFGGSRHEYRYSLQRTWDKSLPTAMFLMMNPSIADVEIDDPTVARCQAFARKWGFGSVYVGNTFAYRTTDQRKLVSVADPVGPDNDRHIIAMATCSSMIVVAYGRPHKMLRQRGIEVCAMLKQHGYALHALTLNADGTPRHPLYVDGSMKPTRI